MRAIVIGAGPTGLEAAVGLAELGIDVLVFERGQVGSELRGWGDTLFFSSFENNLSRRARAALGAEAPRPEAHLTGTAFVERALIPLTHTRILEGRVFEQAAVLAVARKHASRLDVGGSAQGFWVLVRSPSGETLYEADTVIDASGVGILNHLGPSGLPAAGELPHRSSFVRTLAGLERRYPEVAGERLLVVGSGLTVAWALDKLVRLQKTHPDTEVVWLKHKAPEDLHLDPVPDRRQLLEAAEQIAKSPPQGFRVIQGLDISRFTSTDEGVAVVIGDQEEVFKAVFAYTGQRPDTAHLSELPLRLSPESEGLLGVEHVLRSQRPWTPPLLSARDLDTGVPGLYMVGSRAYGRFSKFQLSAGWPLLERTLEEVGQRA